MCIIFRNTAASLPPSLCMCKVQEERKGTFILSPSMAAGLLHKKGFPAGDIKCPGILSWDEWNGWVGCWSSLHHQKVALRAGHFKVDLVNRGNLTRCLTLQIYLCVLSFNSTFQHKKQYFSVGLYNMNILNIRVTQHYLRLSLQIVSSFDQCSVT